MSVTYRGRFVRPRFFYAKKEWNLTEKKLQGRELALEAGKIAIGRHCTDTVVLDLKGKSPATDYFVIATGTSDRQIRNVADDICQVAKKNGHSLFGRAGYDQGKWVLLDFVDIVIHIFDEEYREHYDLELLWGDAEKLGIE